MIISPLLITFIVSIFLSWYLFTSFKKNIVELYHLPSKSSWLIVLVILYCLFFRFLARFFPALLKNSVYLFLINSSYIMLGLLGLLSLMLIILDLGNLFYKVFHDEVNTNNDRREFLKKSFTLSGLIGSGLVTASGYANSFDPKIKNVKIELSDHHKKLNGLKAIQISDVHLGPTLKSDFAEMLVERINNTQPDIIFVTGDLIDGYVDSIAKEVLPLKNLKAPLGVYYVTGNHEYYWNASEWIEFVSSLGIKVLNNESVKLNFQGEDLYICGVTDLYSKKYDPSNAPNYQKAILNAEQDKYKILLAHQPKAVFEASKHPFHLQLSGHTHGGQGFPWNFIVYLVQPYVKGLYQHEHLKLYVNAGTGFWGPPNRFMVDSEITLFNFTL